MAIEYHEGLPGAGKSYEAVVFHIIPALKERRSVVTNIRGMNYEKVAELTGEPLAMIQLLLINVEPAEQDSADGEVQRCINEMCDKTPDNALIVWDEIQDYFPSGNYKLPLNQQKFWTEHRHRGLDIIIMGQDRSDVHKIIRNRIRTVIYFLKQEAIGRPDYYKWEIYQKQRFGKFEKTGSGTRQYDKTYFGTYMSHRREGMRAKVYTTKRTNMLKNSSGLMFGVPLAFGAAIFAVVHLWNFFHPEPNSAPTTVKVERAPVPAPEPLPEPVVASNLANPLPPGFHVSQPSQEPQQQAEPEVVAIDYFDRLAQQYQVRAPAIITSKKEGREIMGRIELLDGTYHVKELFDVHEIQALGWTVTVTGYGLLLEKQGVAHVARAWPIDVYGRVDRHTTNALGAAGGVAPAGAQANSQPGQVRVTVVSDSSRN